MMKKLLLPILSIFLLHAANAQQVYFRGGLGYGIAHGGEVQAPVYSYSSVSALPINGYYNTSTLPGNESNSFDLRRVSYSTGLQGILAMGAMFSKHIGVDVAVGLGLATQQMNSTLFVEQPDLKVRMDVAQQSNLPVTISPTVVIQSGGDKINAYARGGIALPVKAAILQELAYVSERYIPDNNTYITTRVSLTEEFRMRFNPGVIGAVGLQLKSAKQVTFWAELNLLSMNLFYKKSTIPSFDVDGQSLLNQLSQTERETQYEFKSNNGNTNIVPTFQAPFSNLGLHAGVKVDLN